MKCLGKFIYEGIFIIQNIEHRSHKAKNENMFTTK